MKISRNPNSATKLFFDILYEKYSTTTQSDSGVNRQTRLTLGDLNSGHAFDNNCTCFDNISQEKCTCNVSEYCF